MSWAVSQSVPFLEVGLSTHHDLCSSLTIVQEDVQAERHLQRQDKSDTGLDPKGKSGKSGDGMALPRFTLGIARERCICAIGMGSMQCGEVRSTVSD